MIRKLRINIHSLVAMMMSEGQKSFTFVSDCDPEEKDALLDIRSIAPVDAREAAKTDPSVMSLEKHIEIEIDGDKFKSDKMINIIITEKKNDCECCRIKTEES